MTPQHLKHCTHTLGRSRCIHYASDTTGGIGKHLLYATSVDMDSAISGAAVPLIMLVSGNDEAEDATLVADCRAGAYLARGRRPCRGAKRGLGSATAR